MSRADPAGGAPPAATHGAELFLVLECDEAAPQRLAAVLAILTPASLLLKRPHAGPLACELNPLIVAAQSEGIAVLLEDDAALVLEHKADGVHLAHTKDVSARYRAARELLGSRLIVGADAGGLRHDAMVLGEEGADYIGFGLGDVAWPEAAERRLELVAWWAEIFEVPCVAWDVEQAEEASELAGAGADFIGVTLRAGEPVAETVERVRRISDSLLAACSSGGEGR